MRKKRPDLHIDTTQYRKNLLIYAVDTHQSFKIKEVLSSQDIQLHHIHEALRHSKKKFASKQAQKNQNLQQEHLALIKNSAQIIKKYYSVMEGLGFVQPYFPFWRTSKNYNGILTSQIARKIAYIAALDQKCSGC